MSEIIPCVRQIVIVGKLKLSWRVFQTDEDILCSKACLTFLTIPIVLTKALSDFYFQT